MAKLIANLLAAMIVPCLGAGTLVGCAGKGPLAEPEHDPRPVITVMRDRSIHVADRRLTIDTVASALRDLADANPDRQLLVRVEQGTDSHWVETELLNTIRDAGFTGVGLRPLHPGRRSAP